MLEMVECYCLSDLLDVGRRRIVRLIVVAEKKVVYEKFPIPLINRLEKHFLAMETMLTEEQRTLADELQHWAEQFSAAGQHQRMAQRGNRFSTFE